MKKAIIFSAFVLYLFGFVTTLFAQKRILIVVTNNQKVQATIAGKDTIIAGGYELSEVAEAYNVFKGSGFTVHFMSPKGGKTYFEPEEKMKEINKAFIENASVMAQMENTLSPTEVKAKRYAAIYFAGGKTMWDFPDSHELAELTARIYEKNGIVGAVCHGPAALLNVRLTDGSLLLKGKKVSGFTNKEEALFSKTSKFLPFMLQDKLLELGAEFVEAPPMFDQVVVDQRLVTGQNPLSTYSVAEEMVKLLGKTPPSRNYDKLSYTLSVIKAVVWEGKNGALETFHRFAGKVPFDQELFLTYGTFAFSGQLGKEAQSKGIDLLELAVEIFPISAKSHEELAKAYYQLGDSERAIACIEKSLAIDPNSASAIKLKEKIKG